MQRATAGCSSSARNRSGYQRLAPVAAGEPSFSSSFSFFSRPVCCWRLSRPVLWAVACRGRWQVPGAAVRSLGSRDAAAPCLSASRSRRAMAPRRRIPARLPRRCGRRAQRDRAPWHAIEDRICSQVAERRSRVAREVLVGRTDADPVDLRQRLPGAPAAPGEDQCHGGAAGGEGGLQHGKGQRTGLVCAQPEGCLLYTSPSPRDRTRYRMPSSA